MGEYIFTLKCGKMAETTLPILPDGNLLSYLQSPDGHSHSFICVDREQVCLKKPLPSPEFVFYSLRAVQPLSTQA